MKIILTTALALCISFVCLAQSKTISATTSFNGFHCDGKQGICDIDTINRSQANTTLVWHPDNTITFTVARQNLTLVEQENITGINPYTLKTSQTYFFEISQAYILPSAINEEFSKNRNQFILAKGSYPILITEESFTITFTLE